MLVFLDHLAIVWCSEGQNWHLWLSLQLAFACCQTWGLHIRPRILHTQHSTPAVCSILRPSSRCGLARGILVRGPPMRCTSSSSASSCISSSSAPGRTVDQPPLLPRPATPCKRPQRLQRLSARSTAPAVAALAALLLVLLAAAPARGQICTTTINYGASIGDTSRQTSPADLPIFVGSFAILSQDPRVRCG